MKDPRRLAGQVIVGGALAVAVALGWSGVRLATLPARAGSLEGSGLPAELDVERAEIVIDETRGSAWLVGERVACALDLLSARSLGCAALPASRERPRILAARSDLFVVTAAADARDAVAFDWLVLDGAGRVRARGDAGPKLSPAWSSGAAMLNLGWDPGARSPALAFSWNEAGVGLRLILIPIDPSVGAGEPSVRRLGDRDVVTAAFAPDRLLFADRTMRVDGRAEPLPVPEGACVGDRSVSCVAVQGAPRAGEGVVAVLVTAAGEVRRAGELPGAPEASPRPPARQRIAYVTTRELSTPRLSTYAGGQLVTSLADGKRATLEVRAAEGEELLFGRVGDGGWKRLARGASPIESWTVLPHAKGALAIDARTRRAVVLGEDLAPVAKSAPLRTLLEVAHEKWPAADLDVKLFVAAAALFVPLFVLGLRAAFRRRAGHDRERALVALAAWTVATLLFVILRRAALFPP